MTATTNKALFEPANNSASWDSPLNLNFGFLDIALGGMKSFNVTGVTATPVVLTSTPIGPSYAAVDCQYMAWKFTGTITANVNYQIPSGVAGQWTVWNATSSSSYTVTISCAGGGTSVSVAKDTTTIVYCDGTNVFLSDSQSRSVSLVGDVTGSGNSPITTTIAVGVVSNAKLAKENAATFKGVPAQTATVTITIASPAVISWASHGRSVNDAVSFTTTGALPTGITASTTYYVSVVVDANSFQISTTLSGASLNTTGSQSGVHTGTLVDGNPVDMTATQATANLNAVTGDTGSGGLKGLVPSPGAGDTKAGKFLAADASFYAPPVPVRQTVTYGPFDSSGLPDFLPATAVALSVTSQNLSTTYPLAVTSANGVDTYGRPKNFNGAATSDLTWSGLSANSTNYLYVTVANGTLTPGSTTVAPVYQQGGTPAVTSGLFTFNIGEMIGYLGNGSAAPQADVVFVGEAITNGSAVTSTVEYAYNGQYVGSFTTPLTADATTASVNHNVGTDPRVCFLKLKCLSSDIGFSSGQFVLGVGMLASISGSSWYGIPPSLTVTSKTASLIAGNAGWTLEQKTGTPGRLTALTNASWSYQFIVERGW